MTNRQIAMEIADDLFTDGTGRKARRLVMEIVRNLDGSGWGKGAVIDRVEGVLDRRKRRPSKKASRC